MFSFIRVSAYEFNAESGRLDGRSARICAAGPGESFFFGGFDFGLGKGFGVFAGGFGAEALGWFGLFVNLGCCHFWE
jgi:hypothetical protein